MPGFWKVSFGPQPPVAKLCCEDEAKAVAGGGEVVLAAVDEVGLHGGVERVDVAVGVLAGQNVVAFGERVEVGVVLKEAAGELAVAVACSACVGEVEVFGQRVGFVPGVGDVWVWAGGHLFAVEGFSGSQGRTASVALLSTSSACGIVRRTGARR